MNGMHDVGGMQGFGPIPIEKNEPVFHTDWERNVFSVIGSFFAAGMMPLDEFRHAAELMDPGEYLCTPYYSHWLFAAELLAKRYGLFTEEELEQRMRQIAREKQ
jgi:hypothetical protein